MDLTISIWDKNRKLILNWIESSDCIAPPARLLKIMYSLASFTFSISNLHSLFSVHTDHLDNQLCTKSQHTDPSPTAVGTINSFFRAGALMLQR